MKIGSLLIVAAVSAVALAAHAAPATDKPSTTPGITPQARQVVELSAVTADILEATMVCGSTYSAAANVTNRTATAFHGQLELFVGSALKIASFSVGPKETLKVTVQHDKAFNCQAPLGLPMVKVQKAVQGGEHLAQKTLTPKSFTAEKFFPQPGSPQVWVRHMSMTGVCGQAAQGLADLFIVGGAAQTVQADASFGGPPAFKPFTVLPNSPSSIKAASPVVDCQGASGIPAFHSYLQNAMPPVSPTNVVLAQSVTFTPT